MTKIIRDRNKAQIVMDNLLEKNRDKSSKLDGRHYLLIFTPETARK